MTGMKNLLVWLDLGLNVSWGNFMSVERDFWSTDELKVKFVVYLCYFHYKWDYTKITGTNGNLMWRKLKRVFS